MASSGAKTSNRGKLAVALLGGGKMGCDIAALFAAGSWRVHVYEPVTAARAGFARRLQAAFTPLKAARGTASRVQLHAHLQALPWPEVTLVIEAAPEKLSLKQNLMRAVEALARGDAVLATNSSSLKVGDVCKTLKNPARAAGVHFLTPAHIAPLVEVCVAPRPRRPPSAGSIAGYMRWASLRSI